MGERSGRAVPGRSPSQPTGSGCATAPAWARVRERSGQRERGFGSSAPLIIKTCETFVSSLALPLWTAARGLARGRRRAAVALRRRGLLPVQRCRAPESGPLLRSRCSRCSGPERSLLSPLWSSPTKEQKAEPAAPFSSAGDVRGRCGIWVHPLRVLTKSRPRGEPLPKLGPCAHQFSPVPFTVCVQP